MNRKDKSLEILSKKFMRLLFERSQQLVTMDEVCSELKVERRRIYDIINIMESVQLVDRQAKNILRFQGIDSLEAYVHRIHSVFDDKENLPRKTKKKEKQLEYLTDGFIRLFHTHGSQGLSLEQAALQLGGNNISQLRLKTKVRRLYDIANVFKSIGLVRKVRLTNQKPCY